MIPSRAMNKISQSYCSTNTEISGVKWLLDVELLRVIQRTLIISIEHRWIESPHQLRGHQSLSNTPIEITILTRKITEALKACVIYCTTSECFCLQGGLGIIVTGIYSPVAHKYRTPKCADMHVHNSICRTFPPKRLRPIDRVYTEFRSGEARTSFEAFQLDSSLPRTRDEFLLIFPPMADDKSYVRGRYTPDLSAETTLYRRRYHTMAD